eukprot:s119_g6.t1
MCTLADMFAYNLGDGKPRFTVGALRELADKTKVFTVSRVFALEMDFEEAKQANMAEVAKSSQMQLRRGQKPMKRPYKLVES